MINELNKFFEMRYVEKKSVDQPIACDCINTFSLEAVEQPVLTRLGSLIFFTKKVRS